MLARVIDQLNDRGILVTAQAVDSLEADKQVAAEAAASGDFDAIVAAGGDSTIRGTAAGLIGTDLPLGIIPVGTGNVMAAEIGLGRNADRIADILINGSAIPVHGGTIDGEPFFLMAGAGFDADVVSRLSQSLKKRLGKAAYTGPVLSALAGPLPQLHVDIDGTQFDAAWVIVTNARHYGGDFLLSPTTDLHRPGLQTVMLQPRTRTGLLKLMVKLAMGRLEDDRDVTSVQGNQTVISANAPVPVQIDGENFGSTPVTIKPCDESVRLIVPPDFH